MPCARRSLQRARGLPLTSPGAGPRRGLPGPSCSSTAAVPSWRAR